MPEEIKERLTTDIHLHGDDPRPPFDGFDRDVHRAVNEVARLETDASETNYRPHFSCDALHMVQIFKRMAHGHFVPKPDIRHETIRRRNELLWFPANLRNELNDCHLLIPFELHRDIDISSGLEGKIS
jgi:hypothetical protein